ncbi:MAG: type II toxin-antitoxin system PemK/MazF family toxin [Vulcanococcus sp.]
MAGVPGDAFTARDSVVVCLITTDATELPVFRIAVDPTAKNGLNTTSRLMVDKVTTVPKSRLGQCIGCLAADDLLRLNRSLLVFLGLAR